LNRVRSLGGAASGWAPPRFLDSKHTWRARVAWLLSAAVALVLAASLRLELLSTRSLWIDEALSLDIASEGPARIVLISRTAEPHPPGYYLLLWAWRRAFGDSFVAARALSAVLGLLAVLLTWVLGRRLFGEWVGAGAAAVVALHPFQIFASNEVRMYPLLTVVGLVATWSLVRALEGRDGVAWWLVYGVLAAALVYVSYYGFLLLAGHAVAVLLAVYRSRSWRGPVAALAAACAAYAPWLPSLWPSLNSNPLPWRPVPPWWYPLSILTTQTFGGHLLGTPAYHSSGPPSVWWAVLLAPFVVLLAVGGTAAYRSGGAGRLALACWAVPVALVPVASAALRKVVAYNYHLTFLQPYAAVLVALGVARLADAVPRPLRGAVGLGAAAVVLGCLAPAVWAMQTGTGEVYRFDLVARLLQEEQRPGDVTVYFTATGQRVLRWYVQPRGPEVAVAPSPSRWTLEDTRPLLEQAVEPLTPKYRRVWLVLTPPFPPGSVEELMALLRRKGYREARPWVSFGGVFVQLLER